MRCTDCGTQFQPVADFRQCRLCRESESAKAYWEMVDGLAPVEVDLWGKVGVNVRKYRGFMGKLGGMRPAARKRYESLSKVGNEARNNAQNE